MIIAHFGYVASAESVSVLQQLLSILNALPTTWSGRPSVNAVMVGDDVTEVQLDSGDYGLILWPSDTWLAAQDAWSDVGTYTDAGNVRPFALDAMTLEDAKARTVALLNDYQAMTQGLPVPPPSASTPMPTPMPTPTPTPTPLPQQTPAASLVITRKSPPWSWVAAGVVGFAGLLTILAVAGRRPD